MDFVEYLERSSQRKAYSRSERMGQAYFNQLHEDRPDLAERVRLTPLDPFYLDDKIGEFLVFVVNNW